MYTALKNGKGFIRYYWFDVGEKEAVPGNSFSDKNETGEPIQLVADFVKNRLAGISVQNPELLKSL